MVCRGVMMDYENIGAINLHDTRCLHTRTLLFVHRRAVRRIDRGVFHRGKSAARRRANINLTHSLTRIINAYKRKSFPKIISRI